jgi:hypothetical protein
VELGGRFTVLETLGDNAEGERLYASHGLITIPTGAQDAWEFRHLGDPAPVLFALRAGGGARNDDPLASGTTTPGNFSGSRPTATLRETGRNGVRSARRLRA